MVPAGALSFAVGWFLRISGNHSVSGADRAPIHDTEEEEACPCGCKSITRECYVSYIQGSWKPSEVHISLYKGKLKELSQLYFLCPKKVRKYWDI